MHKKKFFTLQMLQMLRHPGQGNPNKMRKVYILHKFSSTFAFLDLFKLKPYLNWSLTSHIQTLHQLFQLFIKIYTVFVLLEQYSVDT